METFLKLLQCYTPLDFEIYIIVLFTFVISYVNHHDVAPLSNRPTVPIITTAHGIPHSTVVTI